MMVRTDHVWSCLVDRKDQAAHLTGLITHSDIVIVHDFWTSFSLCLYIFWTLLPSKPPTLFYFFHISHQDTKITLDYSGRLGRTR